MCIFKFSLYWGLSLKKIKIAGHLIKLQGRPYIINEPINMADIAQVFIGDAHYFWSGFTAYKNSTFALSS